MDDLSRPRARAVSSLVGWGAAFEAFTLGIWISHLKRILAIMPLSS
jgi:hypothetical protein